VELSTQGNFLGWSDAAMVNLVKILELTLNNGQCMQTGRKLGPDLGNLKDYRTFQDLESAFGKMLEHFIERTVDACNTVDRIHREVLPSPFLSSVVRDCMEKGLDVTAGGAHYNYSGVQCIQVANIADSLYALKEAVFNRKKYSPAEMLDALRSNYAGKAEMRHFLRDELPKYGNDRDEVDGMGLKWVKRFAERIGQYKNIRGGKFHTGFYTVSAHIPMGANVGATSDGRLSGQPLADGGMSPMSGMDKHGPTAVLNSVSKIDSRLGSNGTLLNMKFLPAIFRDEKDRKAFVNLLRGFTRLRISHVQFNVVNRSDLLRAREHPDEYRNLTVRVAGYTAYFVDLAEDLQDEIIARTVFGE
jgi:formate C-acetyltransferase